jgi:hypothetical protein
MTVEKFREHDYEASPASIKRALTSGAGSPDPIFVARPLDDRTPLRIVSAIIHHV